MMKVLTADLFNIESVLATINSEISTIVQVFQEQIPMVYNKVTWVAGQEVEVPVTEYQYKYVIFYQEPVNALLPDK